MRRALAACIGMAVVWSFLGSSLVPASAQVATGTITGSVRDGSTGVPLEGITVRFCTRDAWTVCPLTVTDAAGQYTFIGAPDTYFAFTSNSLGYTNEIFGRLLCPRTCSGYDAFRHGTPIAVSANALVADRNFSLGKGGRITGTASDAQTSAPLRVQIVVYREDVFSHSVNGAIEPLAIGSVTTDDAGGYALDGLPSGRYLAFASPASTDYAGQLHGGALCLPECRAADLPRATPMVVAAGADTRADFALARTGRMTGRVVDASTSSPIGDVCVSTATSTAAGEVNAGTGCTDSAGLYAIAPLPPGSYRVRLAPKMSDPGGAAFDPECAFDTGQTITIAPGTTASGIDFSVDLGITGAVGQGTVRGVVSADGSPTQYREVLFYRRIAGRACLVGRVPPGSFRDPVAFEIALPGGSYYALARGGSIHYVLDEIHADQPCSRGVCTAADVAVRGTPIVVTAGVVTNISFDLQRRAEPPGATARLRLGAADAPFSVDLDGDAPVTGGGAEGYVTEAWLTPGGPVFQLPPAPYLNVPPGRYYVRNRAYNVWGVSPPSNELVVLVGPDGSMQPSPPLYVTGWMSGRRLTLTWDDARYADLSGGAPTGYMVEAGSSTGWSNLALLPSDRNSLVYEPVPDGYYFVRIRAVNAAGMSEPSAEVPIRSGDVSGPPGPPWRLTASVVRDKVELRWNGPLFGEPTSYFIEAGSGPMRSNLAGANTGSPVTATSFAGVPGGVYYVRVRAVNRFGASVASNEIVVSVQ